jgi:hypothetical protein
LERHICKRRFGFGGDTCKDSTCYVLLPMAIGRHSVAIKMYIVPGILPPLFSKTSLKNLKVVIDYDLDRAKGRVLVSGKDEPINLQLTTGPSGHYNLFLGSAIKVSP